MTAPSIVQVEWAKGKCASYELSSTGVFSGLMHPPQCALRSRADTMGALPDSGMTFLPCRNRGPIKWCPCALIKRDVKTMIPPSHFNVIWC